MTLLQACSLNDHPVPVESEQKREWRTETGCAVKSRPDLTRLIISEPDGCSPFFYFIFLSCLKGRCSALCPLLLSTHSVPSATVGTGFWRTSCLYDREHIRPCVFTWSGLRCTCGLSVSVPLRRAPRELQQIKTAGREHSLRKPAKGNQGQCEELLMLPLKKGLDLTKVCLLTC